MEVKNQCDGCARGLPVNDKGIHIGNDCPDMQACTAHRYKEPKFGFCCFDCEVEHDVVLTVKQAEEAGWTDIDPLWDKPHTHILWYSGKCPEHSKKPL